MEDNEVCDEQFFDLSLLHPTENAYEILELSIYAPIDCHVETEPHGIPLKRSSRLIINKTPKKVGESFKSSITFFRVLVKRKEKFAAKIIVPVEISSIEAE